MLNHAQLARSDLNLLLVFDLLYEERNAGRAATKLNLSPSAVSHSLRRLRTLLDDPLFLPTAKGMVPTSRAEALAPSIREIVEAVQSIVGATQGFDPATASRRFRVGGPDGAISTIVPRLVERLERDAPGVDLAVLQLLPRPGSTDPEHAWRGCIAELETGRIDVAILPHRPSEARFHSVALYPEDFVIVTRRGHAFAKSPSLEALAEQRHVLVSASGDSAGFVDRLLAERGFERRVVLTVPSFFMAVSAIASSNMIGAIARRFAVAAARDYEIELVEPPFPMGLASLNAIVPRAAMLDQGIAWLLEALTLTVSSQEE